MKVAAYQAPFLELGSMKVADLLKTQVARCETQGVKILCCPEAIFGGLADYVQSPSRIAINAESGELEELLAPLSSETVSTIVGFTETTKGGLLYNSAAVFHRGSVLAIYRKVYPAIRRSVYAAGESLPTFAIGGLHFGIVICNDSNYVEPARFIAAKGAAALFIPSNNGLPPNKAQVVALARSVHIARAVENSMAIVVADIAGQQGSLISYGVTAIYDTDGTILASAQKLQEDLLIADINETRPLSSPI